MVPLEPAAAIARTRHWCSFEPDGKRGSGVTYRSVMTPFDGDLVQEFARFVPSGRRFRQKEPT